MVYKIGKFYLTDKETNLHQKITHKKKIPTSFSLSLFISFLFRQLDRVELAGLCETSNVMLSNSLRIMKILGEKPPIKIS